MSALIARHRLTLSAAGLLPVITEMGELLAELVDEVERLKEGK